MRLPFTLSFPFSRSPQYIITCFITFEVGDFIIQIPMPFCRRIIIWMKTMFKLRWEHSVDHFQFACELRPLPRQTRDRRQNENGHKGCLCADVVLGFLSPPGAGSNGVPLQLLYDFERVHIKAGATGLVTLRTSPKD